MFGCCLAREDEDFASFDVDCSHTLSKAEMRAYVKQHCAASWETVKLNLGIDEEVAITVATDVAYGLAGGDDAKEVSNSAFVLLKRDFASIFSPKNQEFTQRCVFRAYDKDNNGTLDAAEFAAFTDVFFDGTFVKKGDARMAKFDNKEEFKRLVTDKCDTNNNGLFSFEEIDNVIAGKANLKLTQAPLAL